MMRPSALLFLTILALVRPSHAQDTGTLEINGGRIELNFTSSPTPELRKLVLDWISTAARAVAGYYEKFPVSELRLRINIFDGRGVRGGQTFGWNGARIRIAVGNANTAADFADDWMMTHEMIHLAFPSVAEEHHWIEEGLSTYVEPVARARIGELTPTRVWSDWVESMPKGLPASDDRGLDFTPTWGRTYWGGALFCLLADIEIRKRTRNTKGLEDALRAIVRAGGTIESDWPLDNAFRMGDKATGVPVLIELYEKMKAAPAPIDLVSLWKQLGVQRQAGGIHFNNGAPLAPIRRAITNRINPPPSPNDIR
jgi:hypothetical protein